MTPIPGSYIGERMTQTDQKRDVNEENSESPKRKSKNEG